MASVSLATLSFSCDEYWGKAFPDLEVRDGRVERKSQRQFLFQVDELNVQRKAGYDLGHHHGLKHEILHCQVIWKRYNEGWVLHVPGEWKWIGGEAGRLK